MAFFDQKHGFEKNASFWTLKNSVFIVKKRFFFPLLTKKALFLVLFDQI